KASTTCHSPDLSGKAWTFLTLMSGNAFTILILYLGKSGTTLTLPWSWHTPDLVQVTGGVASSAPTVPWEKPAKATATNTSFRMGPPFARMIRQCSPNLA